MYGTEKSDEEGEEVEGSVLGGGSDEVSVMPIFYPRGMVSVSSLGSFFLLVHHLNLPVLSFLYL